MPWTGACIPLLNIHTRKSIFFSRKRAYPECQTWHVIIYLNTIKHRHTLMNAVSVSDTYQTQYVACPNYLLLLFYLDTPWTWVSSTRTHFKHVWRWGALSLFEQLFFSIYGNISSCALWFVFFMDHLLIICLVLILISFSSLQIKYSYILQINIDEKIFFFLCPVFVSVSVCISVFVSILLSSNPSVWRMDYFLKNDIE